ncbi:MAG: DUF1080 domain-containing protein [Armatimonadetes bacterium]|nr:DUF1080 domain-containing protein [Armatimonadota bacterium]
MPSDAIVLFDGSSLAGWHKRGSDEKAGWKVENGYMEVVPGTGDICTRELFEDVQLHVEFWLPLMADCEGQARANSGVYLQGRYEVQVLDSYKLDPQLNDCAAFYTLAAPCVNAARPPENWQSYDIFFHAPRFNELGVKTQNARASVLWNGIWVHHNLEIPGPTGGEIDHDFIKPGPLLLQDHGNLIRFRNIWARKLGC